MDSRLRALLLVVGIALAAYGLFPRASVKTVLFPTNVQLFDTGIDVADGQSLNVSATGTYHWLVNVDDGSKEDHLGHPDGVLNPKGLKYRPTDFPQNVRWGFLDSQADVGALMLVIKNGPRSDVYEIGNKLDLTVPNGGRAFLSVNTRRGPGDRDTGTLRVQFK